MDTPHPRIRRERRTVDAMIALYCRSVHRTRNGLCAECAELAEFARFRLARCPFQERKPTCAKCPVHCYKPHMRRRIKAVMRHAGPRMLRRHPILALRHLMDGRRPAPDTKKGVRKIISPTDKSS